MVYFLISVVLGRARPPPATKEELPGALEDAGVPVVTREEATSLVRYALARDDLVSLQLGDRYLAIGYREAWALAFPHLVCP